MSWHIVGIEGDVPADATVAWGAAAVSDGKRLYNNFTQVSTPVSHLERLRDEKHLHVFNKPIEIDADDASEELLNRPGFFGGLIP